MDLHASHKSTTTDVRTDSRKVLPVHAQPRVPLAPVASFRGLFRRKASGYSVFNNNKGLPLTSGRIAIATAIKHANLPSGSEVLLPALHCEAMVTPVRWAGMKVIFYPLKPDLSIDLTRIDTLLSKHTRALLITHFFGFPQATKLIREFCDKRDLMLIEDCAHAYYGIRAGATVGTLADYAIASTVKFLPVFDGGILYSSKHDLGSVTLHSAPFRFQLKAAVNIFDRGVGYGRLGPLGTALNALLKPARKMGRGRNAVPADPSALPLAPASAEGGYDFEPFWYGKKMSVASRVIAAFTDEIRVLERRRLNYARLLASTQSLTGCHALFPNLSEGIVPLIFPLYVDHAVSAFSQLKALGVPMWRFGEYLDPEVRERNICVVSQDYGEHLLQFPCHQDLRASELDWIIHCLRKVLG